MEPNIEQSQLDQKMNTIIAQNEGYSETDISLEEQEKYLSRYSFSALVCSAIYFWYMKDKVFFWISVMSSILFPLTLFVLPLLARRRAWKMREWHSFSHFQSVQKKWDEGSVYGLIIFVFVFGFAAYYEVKMLSNLLNSSGINNINDVEQMQQDLGQILGS
ncbi:MAG: hypothetical protein M1324_02015 [Patescibacteria group bacterium]|nr:hypothetical protein [Patescibacteria group bacterium]